jgi:hypothetical protein
LDSHPLHPPILLKRVPHTGSLEEEAIPHKLIEYIIDTVKWNENMPNAYLIKIITIIYLKSKFIERKLIY